MPHVTAPIVGSCCLVNVHIGPGRALREACKAYNVPEPSPVLCKALVDTGASGTCIDPSILTKTALVPKSQRPVLTPSTGSVPHMANVFDVAVYLVHAGDAAFPGSGYTLAHELEAIESILKPLGIDALLGMDVLRRCLLIVDGPSDRFSLAI